VRRRGKGEREGGGGEGGKPQREAVPLGRDDVRVGVCGGVVVAGWRGGACDPGSSSDGTWRGRKETSFKAGGASRLVVCVRLRAPRSSPPRENRPQNHRRAAAARGLVFEGDLGSVNG